MVGALIVHHFTNNETLLSSTTTMKHFYFNALFLASIAIRVNDAEETERKFSFDLTKKLITLQLFMYVFKVIYHMYFIFNSI